MDRGRPLRLSWIVAMILLTIPLVSLPTRADDPAPRQAARDDFKKLQGSWQCVAMEREGNPIPAEDLKGTSSIYEDDRITLIREGAFFRRGIVTIDPTKSPKRMNTWDLAGPFEDQTVPGIYELDGETLKVCFSRPGVERPVSFTTKEGSGLIFCIYKRVKP